MKNERLSGEENGKRVALTRNAFHTEFRHLSGKQILDRIVEDEEVRDLLPVLPAEDLSWLVKKIGEDDSIPLLAVASLEQWQYLMDLELWKKDRLDLKQASSWLARLFLANPYKLSKWLYTEGETFASYYFSRYIDVEIKKEDEDFDLKDGFFTFDEVFYLRVVDETHRETIENILRTMAIENHLRFQALILGLAGVNPAELEEEMYRLKNVRLAEHGFLPFEEALSVYAPLNPKRLITRRSIESPLIDAEVLSLAPRFPLQYVEAQNLLMEVNSRVSDHVFMDRLHLEFAGLCNQILSADGLAVSDFEVLVKTCQKAGGYLNLALENLCGDDISLAERLIRNNSLVSIFRVGFGFGLQLKWDAERWIESSWFQASGLKPPFWGDPWGETLSGLLERRPKFYKGSSAGGDAYRDYARLSELEECRLVLRRLGLLDRLLARLTKCYPPEDVLIGDPELTFYSLLFTLWARRQLNIEPTFRTISLAQAKTFFRRLRTEDQYPPYRMPGYEERFLKDLLSLVEDIESEDEELLKGTLSQIWHQFTEEYEWVRETDLDRRFSKFVRITS